LNPFEPWPAELALAAAAAHDVKVITRVVDHGGVFWDDVRPGHAFLPGDHRSFRPAGWVQAATDKLERLRPLAERHRLTTLQLACVWNLAHEAVACVAPTFAQEVGQDARPVEDKRAELAALTPEQPLTEEELQTIRTVGENRGSVPLKGASRQYSGPVRADQWPMTPQLEEVARRWHIQPDRDLHCAHDLRDLRERGAPAGGPVQALDRRLFITLQAFTEVSDAGALTAALQASGLEGVIYASLTDPRGSAVLLLDEDPDRLFEAGRQLFAAEPFAALEPVAQLAMLGRTYGSGHEPDLEDWLLHAPRRKLAGPQARWAIWYPLRRTGAFYRLSERERGRILAEHGRIGRVFADAGYADDIRLECFGLDRSDNEYLIGLIGPRLDALSRLVKAMRATEQTARYMERLGPFLAGPRIAHTIRTGG
ncbi:MAG TPA: chlorite dismutase family protein, partial [Solirubrobacteraceae bacterium]|nr:chlorite dismutase family protein [Solirubrobacteraceae bacterium]